MLEDALPLSKATASNQTLSTVESCTGGLLFVILPPFQAHLLCWNAALLPTVIVQTRNVGVTANTLAAFGAVSQQTAEEMAKGGCQNARTDLLTDRFRPSGGSAEKPVGLV